MTSLMSQMGFNFQLLKNHDVNRYLNSTHWLWHLRRAFLCTKMERCLLKHRSSLASRGWTFNRSRFTLFLDERDLVNWHQKFLPEAYPACASSKFCEFIFIQLTVCVRSTLYSLQHVNTWLRSRPVPHSGTLQCQVHCSPHLM